MRYAPLIAVVLLLTAGSSFAFELLRTSNNPCSTAQHLFWPSRRAAVDTHFLPSQFATYATTARERWNGAIGSFQFVGGIGNLCDPSDGITSMALSRTVCGGGGFGDAVSITVYRFNTNSGEMLDADVSFDSSDSFLTTDAALFTQIAMHELGHVLGLAHSDACGGSGQGTLMQAVTPLNEPRLSSPQADDVAGALAIYPNNGSDAPATNPGCALSPPNQPWRPPLELLAGAVIALLARALCARPLTTHEHESRS
ncbi:MAG: matrixin family metalloprotease [Deltaproteobacteria bacterium]|nr:matrixin family metalloprotease [Deltaproteobacteria bacterium]MBI3390424.1 matrixin family metalloprotease [Deltaproteobacteria bacterium]